MKQISEMLEEIGLTKMEATTYLALVELQQAQTGIICKRTKIASSNIYLVLSKLIEKGLVSYRVQNNIRVYMPSPPEALQDIIAKKQAQLEDEKGKLAELLLNLKKITPDELISHYKYFEGIKGIKSLWREIEEHMQKTDILRIYTGKPESYASLAAFYAEYHESRIAKQVQARMIFPEEDTAVSTERQKLKLTKIRRMKLDNLAEWGTIGKFVFIQHIGKIPRGFLIQDKVFADSFADVFDKLWQEAN